MAKIFRKMIVTLAVLALLVGVMSVSALAASGTGTGQTQVHIHGVEGLAPNKSEVVIIVDGKEYTGTLQGSKLTIEMDSTDNGFDFGADESMDVGYRVGDQTGTLTLTHKEGNGTNIGKEHDQGLNNFNGTVKQPENPTPENPTPENPNPENPNPENPTPENPTPENPNPENPNPENPNPENPNPENPNPENPNPENPNPENPNPENPNPENPNPEDNGDPLPEPGSNLPTAPREDPEVEIEVLPDNDPPAEEPPYIPEFEFPVIPPVVDEPVVEIEEPEVPLAEVPEVEETEDLTEEILDEEVPLAEVPYTGSLSILWILIACLSAASLVFTGAKRKQ